MVISDPYSGSELVVYYRPLTTTEVIQYSGELAALGEGDPLRPLFTKFGRLVITGYRDGDFGIDSFDADGNGYTKTVDSSPQSGFFDNEWKQLVFPEDGQNDDILAVVGNWAVQCAQNVRRVAPSGAEKKK